MIASPPRLQRRSVREGVVDRPAEELQHAEQARSERVLANRDHIRGHTPADRGPGREEPG